MACEHSHEAYCAICSPTVDPSARPTAIGFAGPGDEPEGTDPEVLQAGARIGRYVVLERLGTGGMGVLFKAHDPQLNRVVAIKVLRGALATRSSGAQDRLLREAQAMAQLSHPNVVPIYDSGPFGSGIFIAMELIEGTTLDLWMREKHPWREVLAMFVEAGRGLEAAHQKGFIHRDFKPANVLIGADGRPRVTDFGLARSRRSDSSQDLTPLPHDSQPISSDALARRLTQAGVMMGSPGYMAPEQYEGGETSEATDQFSFCVSLYEALYGRKLFEGESIKELAAATYRGEVPLPARSKVPRWVHKVLVRGLAQETKARFPSMGALLTQLSFDPVRRTRWVLAAVAVVELLALAGGAAWQTSARSRACRGMDRIVAPIWNEDARTRSESAFLATKEPFAQASWLITRDALNTWVKRWLGARTEACEASRVRGEQTARQMLLRLECLDRRLTEFETLVNGFSSVDGTMVASASTAVARLTPLDECENVKQLEDRKAPPPQLEDEARLLADQLAEARALVISGRLAEARAELTTLTARTIELQLPSLEASAHEAFGELHVIGREFVDARQEYQRAVRAAEVAADDRAAARVLSRMVSLVGWRLQKPDEARTWAALASGILERIGGDVATQARIEEGLGDAEWQAGDRAASLAAYRRALDLAVKADGKETLDVARLHSALGWVLTEQGELEAARAELDTSRTLRERLLGPRHPELADTWNELATLSLELRDFDDAIKSQEVSLALSTTDSRKLSAQISLAAVLSAAGQPQRALELTDPLRAVVDADKTPAPWVELGRVRVQALARLGRIKEALTEGRATLSEQERRLGKLQPEVATMADVLGEVCFKAGLFQESLELSERYLAMKATLGGADSPRTAETLVRAAAASLALKHPLEAAPKAERALVALEKGKLDRALRAEARRVLGEALLAVGGDTVRAESLLRGE